MRVSRDVPERLDLSSLSLSADPASREALVVRILARYRQREVRRLDLWSALVAYGRRPVAAVACASAVLAILSTAAVEASRPQPPLIPSPIVRWLASPSTPTPVEIMEALSELPR